MPPPFIPDVPYRVQIIFIACFYYIWSSAFTDDYLEPLPTDPEKRKEILVSYCDHKILHLKNH
jgi:hypothetical protein